MPKDQNQIFLKRPAAAPVFFRVRKNFISVKHWQNAIEIVYVKSGWVDIHIDGVNRRVEKNHLLFISSGVMHFFITDEPDSVIYVIKMMSENIIAPQFSEPVAADIIKLYRHSFIVEMNDAMKNILEQIISSDFRDLSGCYLTAKLMELTVYLLSNPQLIFSQISAGQSESSRDLIKMLKFIESNSSKKITLDELSGYLGFSKCYCSKYIKKKTNMTFLECLNAIRISRAEELLQQTDNNITEIAFKVGFTGTQSFDRVFKSMKNLSPTEYRKRLYDKK